MSAARLLAILGSGETAPTMSAVHRELFERAGPAAAPAVMLDTPFGFQENADEVAQRSVAYFRDSVGREVEVASFRNAETAPALEYEQMCARLAAAGWAFAGPGSPTYAIRQWRGTRVPELLAAKLREGGVVVLSSAAAVGLGELALPVYEVYKVGAPPVWIEGLDLLRVTGLRAAVVPHYNNAEGGTHDTRFCYMGERRLRVLEEQLPEGCAILGVDEHTACIIDLVAGVLEVRGRGRVVWRVHGEETQWRAGESVPLAGIGSEAAATRPGRSHPDAAAATPAAAPESPAVSPFMEEVTRQRDAGRCAVAARDPAATAAAILALESAIHDWSSDTLQSDEPDRARAALREMVAALGDLAASGAADPRERLAPLVDALLSLRDEARSDRRFGTADRIRDAVAAAGVEVHDTREGTTWDLAEAAST